MLFCLSFKATSDVWTGLNDLFVPGMFAWSDHHIVSFTYWAPGEPNNHPGFSEDCVKMLHQVSHLCCSSLLTPPSLYCNSSLADVEFHPCSRTAGGTTCPVQSSTPTSVKLPELITQHPL